MPDGATFTPLAALGDYKAVSDDEMRARARAFLDAARRRHTVREFAPDPVPRAVIEDCIRTAGLAPSGANHQPWHFVLIGDPATKTALRAAAEKEEAEFYSGKAPQEWLEALAPLGTDAVKPYMERAPWLIAVFAQRRGGPAAGDDKKNYYINESVGIAVGFLVLALHNAGLVALTHTPNPMGFLNETLKRPANEKPYMIVVAGRPAADAQVPDHAMKKKSLDEIMTLV
jgi:nitroreductase